MPIPVITSIISACSILAGSAMGAWFSWLINNKMHMRKMKEEHDLIEDNRKYEEKYKIKETCANANSIRLDVCTAIYQSIRVLKNKDIVDFIYPIPINKNYACAVASLSDKYTIKELSYIYQLYGIIERVNYDMLHIKNKDTNESGSLKNGFEFILKKIYGVNYTKVIEFDIDNITYKNLCENEYIKYGYKHILSELNYICAEENLAIERL
ncbi:MAG: hypothetical protein ACRCVJ_00900 [Clostridium sp.]|uniref:hypothetical protein n=1 Tax=Clostridium sp. TaxID=1506 RepID=UPI003F3F2F4B